MQKANLHKTNFSAGEVSPAMGGRLDTARFKNGAAEITNFVVQPQGGLVRRMGTKFITEVKDSTKVHKLVPFRPSIQEAYILEFGNNSIRIINNDAVVLNTGVPVDLVTTYSSAQLAEIYYTQSADVLYVAHPDHAPKRVLSYSVNNWAIDLATTEDGPYQSPQPGDSSITLWLEDIIHTAKITSTENDFNGASVGRNVEYWKDGSLVLGFVETYISPKEVWIIPAERVVDLKQLDNSAVITFDNVNNRVLSSRAIWSSETEYSFIRTSSGVWHYMTTHNPIPQVVGTSPNSYTADVMTRSTSPAMISTFGKLSFSEETIDAALRSSSPLFLNPDDIGRKFRLNFSGKIVWGTITAILDTDHAVVSLGNMVPLDTLDGTNYINNGETTDWRLGAWFAGNYPRVVTFHQGRLVYGGTRLEQNRIWFSKADDYVSFATTNLLGEVLDDNGINIGIVSGEVNTILWAQSGPVLLIGTNGEEFQIKPTSISEALTSSNINVTVQTPYGSESNIRPIKIGPSTLFVQNHGQRLRELMYNFEIDSFVASDTTVISEHIFRKHISAVDMAYTQTPNSVLWFLGADGKLISLTYEKDQEVYAWTNHELGGNAFVESIASIPSEVGKQDRLHMIVRRTINGVTKRYIERFHDEFNPSSPTDKDGMNYLDCSYHYEGAAITTVTGLNHLEGELVSVVANNAIHPDRTVVSGQIQLDYSATDVLVGYTYESRVQTLPTDDGSQFGTSHGKLKKVHRVDCQLLNTIGIKYGRDLNQMDIPRSFRETNGTMGQSPDLFTGIIQLTDESSFNRDGQFFIVQDQPYPCTILSLMPIIKVNE